MEMISELLEKYFRGETNLTEEAEIKKYFASGHVSSEHELYRELFDAFAFEKGVVAPKHAPQKLQKTKLLKIMAISFSGVAASFILLFGIFRIKPVNENYAIINGKRIDSHEFVEQYAVAKMEKSFAIFNKSMQPMTQMNKLEERLKPLYNAENNMQNTNNKLQKIEQQIEIHLSN